MADERDPNNPLDRMMPPADNPEYHKKLAAHRETIGEAAEAAIMADPSHAALGDRISRVRHEVPQAALPQPAQQQPTAAPEPPPESSAPVQGTPTPAALAPVMQAPAAPGVQATPPLTAATSGILSKLREDFGIDSIPMEDVRINDHVFTMRVLDMASVTTALRFADTLSMPGSDRENALNLQIALTSFAVMGIDKAPLYEVFNSEIPSKYMTTVEGALRPTFAPMLPPMEIRILAASSLMEWLSTSATASLVGELWEQYKLRVDKKSTLDSLMSSFETEEEPSVPLP